MEPARSAARQYRVLSEMTAQGRLTVADPASQSVFQVVSYQDDALYDRLAAANIGSMVTIGIAPRMGWVCLTIHRCSWRLGFAEPTRQRRRRFNTPCCALDRMIQTRRRCSRAVTTW